MPESMGKMGGHRAQRRYVVNNALAAVRGRQQLLCKQVRRGDSPEQLLAQCDAMERTVEGLRHAIQQLDEPSPDGADG
jgi:hypothetical protein